MSGKLLSLHYQPKHNGIHGSNKEPRTGHQLAEERAETTAGMATGSETTLGKQLFSKVNLIYSTPLNTLVVSLVVLVLQF